MAELELLSSDRGHKTVNAIVKLIFAQFEILVDKRFANLKTINSASVCLRGVLDSFSQRQLEMRDNKRVLIK